MSSQIKQRPRFSPISRLPPGEFPLTKEPEDSGYKIWFRHVTSRFPFCLASIFETKQIGKKFEIVVHPCHMNGNKDSCSE